MAWRRRAPTFWPTDHAKRHPARTASSIGCQAKEIVMTKISNLIKTVALAAATVKSAVQSISIGIRNSPSGTMKSKKPSGQLIVQLSR